MIKLAVSKMTFVPSTEIWPAWREKLWNLVEVDFAQDANVAEIEAIDLPLC
jgi:hypothetical protein